MRKVILDFLRLIRINNLLIISATQVFAYYFLSPGISLYTLFQLKFLLLMTSTFLVAAAGYIINDYMDVMLDLVNKPDKVIVGKSISRRLACSICLWGYSQLLKKTYLSGNILVALLTASTLFILLVFDSNLMQAGIWVYALFAFLSTLIREIIKDTEDLRGDQQFKAKTLPIVLGIRKTKEIIFWLHMVLIGLTLTYCSYFAAISISGNRIYVMFLMYMLILVLVPMFAMAWLIKVADVKKDFTRLSFLSKLVMLSGIISMLFWRF